MPTDAQPNPRTPSTLLPSGRAWWVIAAASLVGIALFLVVWQGKRDEFDFYRAEPSSPAVPGQTFEPLPAPLPAGSDVSEFGGGTAPAQPSARLEPSVAPGGAVPADEASSGSGAVETAPGFAGDASVPTVLTAPPPDYPRAALRAGAAGDVVLRIDVGADGRATAVNVERGSRHRSLDRAAVQAVRRWRFQPAMRDGVAVPGTVRQTIRFDPPR